MAEPMRDTVFGHIVRFVSRGRYFRCIGEKDPSLWKWYLDREGTANIAKFGHHQLSPEEEEEKKGNGVPADPEKDKARSSSEGSSSTRVGNAGEERFGQQLHSTSPSQVTLWT